MKIAHVTIYPPRGEKHVSSSGVASYSKNLVTNISSGDQTVISNVVDGVKVYTEDGITIERVFNRGAGFIFSVHNALRILKPDVIHIQQELALFGGVASAYLLQWLVFLWRDKTIVTLHGVVDPGSIDKKFVSENNSSLPDWLVRIAFYVIYKPLMVHAKHIIVHEQFFKDIITESYHIDSKKVSVIPHGVETFEATNTVKARIKLGLPKNADLALFMGYATGYKGLDLLMEGFGSYATSHPNAFLVIGAGKHPKLHEDATYLKEYERLQNKAKELIPANQYIWRGFIDEGEIGDYYSACDVSLYPYTTALSSSGPMSFAIGYEKPFLVSDAFAEIFHGYPQLVFQRNSNALAERLDYFFTHRDEYSNLSQRLKTQRTWKNVGDQTLETYLCVTKSERRNEAKERATTG